MSGRQFLDVSSGAYYSTVAWSTSGFEFEPQKHTDVSSDPGSSAMIFCKLFNFLILRGFVSVKCRQ